MNKVLIVDDDKYFTDDLSIFLEMEGVKADVINQADELFSKVNGLSKYDVVLLDVMFRKGSHAEDTVGLETGEAFYRVFRKIYPNKKVVVVSAKDKENINISFNSLNTLYVPKPLSRSINEILDLVKDV